MSLVVEQAEPDLARDDPPPGMTFAIESIGFIDFETRSRLDVKRVGAYRYARHAWPIMLAYAIGEGDEALIETGDIERGLAWDDLPQELHDFQERVERGDAVWCAHNAAFDRQIWNHSRGFPRLEPWMIIDSSVQAAAAGLPGGLNAAAVRAGAGEKDTAGTSLIKLFSMKVGPNDATPQSHPLQWQQFGDYAMNDVTVMRELFKCTLQLPEREWQEYWAAENINERGVMVDIAMCVHADALATIDHDHCDAALIRLTDSRVGAVTQVARIAHWLDANLDPQGRAILTTDVEEVDEETGETLEPAKFSLRRERVDLLLAYLADKTEPDLVTCRKVLEIRRFGGSNTPHKFRKMVEQQIDGVIYGQYVFNGAGQTGRFSSRGGPQLHNLMRSALDYELDAVDALLAGCSHADLAALGDPDTPVARKLSMLIRPAIIARPNRVFVWSDLSQIEARVLPWLANSPQADRRLDIFREVDADPSKPDLYTISAADMFNLSVAAVDKAFRQRGKIAELAAGFGGGAPALQRMAANYGARFEDDTAKDIIARWRRANPWAPLFWGAHTSQDSYGLWGAFNQALEQPNTAFRAGRITYICMSYLGRWAVFCELPSGRLLTYRNVRVETFDVLDEKGVIVDRRQEMVFDRGFGTKKLWHGLLAENVTQACAADILRGTIARIEDDPGLEWLPLVAHTHDELVAEPLLAHATRTRDTLADAMRAGFHWSDELPIMSDETLAFHYTKSESESIIWH